MVVATSKDSTTRGVLNPTTEPEALNSAKVALAFKNLDPSAIDSANLHKSKVKSSSGAAKLALDVKGVPTYLYAEQMGLTPDTATAIEALPERAALIELRRLARFTAAMAGNERVDMTGVPSAPEPVLEEAEQVFSDTAEKLSGVQRTKTGDELTVMHPEPYVEEPNPHVSGETVILKKGSKTTVTQKYIIYTTSDGHAYRIKRGSLGALVPASAFPAMVNYMQQQKEDLIARAKALEVVLSATDKELGPSAAEWLHVLLTTYVLKPNPDNKAALSGALNEFWATAKMGRSKAWDGIARRYNSNLGMYAFLPSWLRPAENEDGTIDGAKRVAELSYAVAASGGRATIEHGRITINAGSNFLGKVVTSTKKAAGTAARTAARAARRAAAKAKEVVDDVREKAGQASDDAGNTYLECIFAELKSVVKTIAGKVSSPFVRFWSWLKA